MILILESLEELLVTDGKIGTVDSAVNATGGGVRKAKTAATRRRMVTAAYELFCTRGYQATTMAEIAAQAQVAVQTLYFTFSTKSALLQEAFGHAVLGPEPLPPHLQPWFGRMRRAPDLRRGIAQAVSGSIVIFERVAPLITAVRAAATDPDVAAIFAHQEQLRRVGYTNILGVLVGKGPLRAGLSSSQATDVMFVLLSPDMYRAFVAGCGWTSDRYQTWVTTALLRELFGEPPDPVLASAH